MANRSNKKQVAGNGVSTNVAIVSPSVRVQEPRPSWFRSDWFLGLILILSVILTYTPVWHAEFIWDDDTHLTANPCIVGPFGFKEIWTTKAAGICPLVYSTFWLEHAMWGLAPLPYYLINVLLHGVCAVLLWWVLRSLRVPGAWLGAALWAMHPVAVESVAWITEMKNTESGLFFLLSILFFLRWLRVKDFDGGDGGGWYYGLTFLFAALAMASKSSTVILPVVLCLCAWWMEGRWHWRNVVKVIPIFPMSIAASALSMWTQGLQLAGITDPQWIRTWPQRVATAGDAVWFYLGKLLFPYPLITIYPRWKIDAGQWAAYLPLLFVIVALCILWVNREPWSRACLFAFAYFITALLPVLGLIDNYIFHYSLVFDHFQYLASIGPLALMGTGLVRFSEFIIPNKAWLQSSLCAGLLLILSMVSWRRTLVYESEETIWTDTIAKNPNCLIAYNNLGGVYLQNGRVEQALAQFRKALEMDPYFEVAHSNLGLVLLQKGQVDEAIEQFTKASEIDPNDFMGRYNLGNALLQKGRLDDAIAQYQRALEISPNYAMAYNNLGNALLQKGRLDDAIAQYQRALEIKPNDFTGRYNLGNALFQKGQLDGAIHHLRRALEIKPSAEAYNTLGNVLSQKGQVGEAITPYQKALEINRNSAEIHRNLGLAILRQGQAEEASTEFQKALEINPDYAEAQSNLGDALVQQGQMPEAIARYQKALEINPNYVQARANLGLALLQQGDREGYNRVPKGLGDRSQIICDPPQPWFGSLSKGTTGRSYYPISGSFTIESGI